MLHGEIMERVVENRGRTWHAVAQVLWLATLVACAACSDAGGDDHGNGGDQPPDARVMDGGNHDAGTAGDSGPHVDASTDRDAGHRTIWNDDSIAIDFTLRGPVAQFVCKFSATRDELTPAQLAGLAALELHDAMVQAGCDIETYAITIHARNGSSKSFVATIPICASQPIVLFSEFDAWAQSTPCSSRTH